MNANNAMIEGQNEERQRIANDLHDRLGGMLSTIKLLFSSLEDKVDKNISNSNNMYKQDVPLLMLREKLFARLGEVAALSLAIEVCYLPPFYPPLYARRQALIA